MGVDDADGGGIEAGGEVRSSTDNKRKTVVGVEVSEGGVGGELAGGVAKVDAVDP